MKGTNPRGDWSWKGPEKPKNKKRRKKNKQKKAGAGFYSSWEWKKLRYRVLKFYGPICMLCGATNKDGKRIVVDHINPIRRYPKLALSFDNLQVLCNDCNMGKSDCDDSDFREPIGGDAASHLREILKS